MKPDYKLVAKAKYIHLTADLAAEVWQECYQKYYPHKQLAALVGALQSPDAIEADIDGGANYFVVQLGGKPIGYFAWKMEPTALHLLHLYLLPAYRGKALGRDTSRLLTVGGTVVDESGKVIGAAWLNRN